MSGEIASKLAKGSANPRLVARVPNQNTMEIIAHDKAHQVPRMQNHDKRESIVSVPRVKKEKKEHKSESTASVPRVEKEQKVHKPFMLQHQPSHFHQNATIIQQVPLVRYTNKLQVPRRLNDKPDNAVRWQIASENCFGRMITAKAPSRTYRTITNHAKQQYAASNRAKLLSTICGAVRIAQTYATNFQIISKANINDLRRNFVRVTLMCEGVLIQG